MTQEQSIFSRIMNIVRNLMTSLFAEPAYVFDEEGYEKVFTSDGDSCIHSFDCNAGDHSDACPMGK